MLLDFANQIHYFLVLKTTKDNYNIIGFDQRGMGRSLPSFANEDCSIIKHDRNNFSIIDGVEFDQPETIRAGAQVWKDRSLACWDRPEFKLTVKKRQGVEKVCGYNSC